MDLFLDVLVRSLSVALGIMIAIILLLVAINIIGGTEWIMELV